MLLARSCFIGIEISLRAANATEKIESASNFFQNKSSAIHFSSPLTSFLMFSEVDSTVAPTPKLLLEVVIVLNVALTRIDEPLSLDSYRPRCLPVNHLKNTNKINYSEDRQAHSQDT